MYARIVCHPEFPMTSVLASAYSTNVDHCTYRRNFGYANAQVSISCAHILCCQNSYLSSSFALLPCIVAWPLSHIWSLFTETATNQQTEKLLISFTWSLISCGLAFKTTGQFHWLDKGAVRRKIFSTEMDRDRYIQYWNAIETCKKAQVVTVEAIKVRCGIVCDRMHNGDCVYRTRWCRICQELRYVNFS